LFKQFIRNSSANIIYRIVTVFSSLIATPILINSLGSINYGLIAYLFILTINGYVSLLDSGFSGAITKYIAEYSAIDDERNLFKFINISVFLYIFIGLISSLLILFFGFSIVKLFLHIEETNSDLIRINLYIISALNFIDFIGLSFISILQGLQRFDIIRTNQIIKTATYLLLIIIFAQKDLLRFGWLSSLFVANLLSYFLMFNSLKKLKKRWHLALVYDKNVARTLLSFSGKIFILRITGVVYNNISKTLVGYFGKPNDITTLDVAQKVNNIGNISQAIFSPLIVPASSDLNAKNDFENLRKLYLRGTLITSSFAINSMIILMLSLKQILKIWINPEFSNNALTINLFISYLLFYPLVSIGWNMIIGIGNIRKIIYINVFTVTLIVILALLLVPRYMIIGLGISFFLSNLISTILYLKYFNSYFQVYTFEFIRNVVFKIYSVSIIIIVLNYAIDWLLLLINYQSTYLVLFKLGFIFLLSLVIQFYFVLNKIERIKIKNYLVNIGVCHNFPRDFKNE